MIQQINGRLAFVYAAPRKQSNKPNLKLSLLGILMGIFLLPNLAYLSAITPENIIEQTNEQRQAAGLNDLTANQLLTRAAMAKSRAILNSQTFGHTIADKKFSSWIREAGYNYSYAGENLAIDFSSSEGVIEAWDNSPLHKKNLLNSYYQEIGVAVADGKFQGQNTTVVVQIFGAPAIASVQPLSSEINGLSRNYSLPEVNFSGQKFISPENLLTNAVLNQPSLPAGSKLILPEKKLSDIKTNTFFIQPENTGALNNILLIYLSFIAVYFLLSLYAYYFQKINKLISI